MNSNFSLSNQAEQKTVLFFADLDPSVVENDIKEFLGDYLNDVAHLTIKVNKNSPYVSAIVIFKDHLTAKKAKETLNMKKLKNKSCRIMWHDKEQVKSLTYHSENNNIFIKNIPLEVTPRDVYVEFLKYGEIASVKINENLDGTHKGYGYISYENSDSAVTAIQKTNGKPVFPKYSEFLLEVEFFKKSNERSGKIDYSSSLNEYNKVLQTNSSVFVKNIPEFANENDLKELFSTQGEVIYFKPNYSDKRIVSCIIGFSNETTALAAEKNINNSDFKGSKIVVEKLIFTTDPKSIQRGYQEKKPFVKNCGLYVRNIPEKVNEEILKNVFSQFGTVKQVYLYKSNIMQKIDGVFKEKEVSNGIGQVHFDTQEEAMIAKEKMSGKFIPGFETWKNPLFVDIYVSPKERAMNEAPVNMNYYNQVNPMMNLYMNQNTHYSNQNNKYGNPYQMNQNQGYYKDSVPELNKNFGNLNLKKETINFVNIDIKQYEAIHDQNSKRELLGECIFNNINIHPMLIEEKISMEEVGKITGMILGIDDLNEILLSCTNYNELTLRIKEALNLIRN